MHTFHITLVSANSKTGPIPVTTSSASTCPITCPFRKSGCYAEHGHLRLHWDQVNAGARGGTLAELCDHIRALPRHQLWRWGQAGDLPGDGTLIDADALAQITDANRGRRGFGFTHYDPLIPHNARAIARANAGGFTLNLSANNLDHADELARLKIAPVVTVLPDSLNDHLKTNESRHVSICPAVQTAGMTCARCGICATQRRAIIGFPAHGTGKAKATVITLRRGVTNDVTRDRRSVPESAGSFADRQKERA